MRPDPPPMGRGNFEGRKRRPVIKCRDTVVNCAETAEPIEMSFGIWTQVGPRKHVLADAIWQMPLNRAYVAVMHPVVKLF